MIFSNEPEFLALLQKGDAITVECAVYSHRFFDTGISSGGILSGVLESSCKFINETFHIMSVFPLKMGRKPPLSLNLGMAV